MSHRFHILACLAALGTSPGCDDRKAPASAPKGAGAGAEQRTNDHQPTGDRTGASTSAGTGTTLGAPTCEEIKDTVAKASPDDAKAYWLQCRLEEWDVDLRRRCGAPETKREQDACLSAVDSDGHVALKEIGKKLRDYHAEHGKFPPMPAISGDSVPAFPPKPCCEHDGHHCAPDPSLWAVSPWKELGFSINQPTRFQYVYVSSDAMAMVGAGASLDCAPGAPVYTYQLTAEAQEGIVTSTLTMPEP